jgi:hypothetical protein
MSEDYAIPAPVNIEAYRETLPTPSGPAVVGDGETDDVLLSAIQFKNMSARRSLSVYHMQRRLSELGFTDTDRDPKGFYGDYTKAAISQFQVARGLDSSVAVVGIADAQTLASLFTGDPNVTLVV